MSLEKLFFMLILVNATIVGVIDFVTLAVIFTCTNVLVKFILQFEKNALSMTWLTTIGAVSTITRIFLKIVMISAILTVIFVELCLPILFTPQY
jgi:hypothetical protein